MVWSNEEITLTTGLEPTRASHNNRQESSPTLQNSCELQHDHNGVREKRLSHKPLIKLMLLIIVQIHHYRSN